MQCLERGARRRSRGDGTRIKIEARWKVNFWRIDLTLFITVFLYRTLTSRAREPTSRQYEGETEISFIIYNNMRDGGIGWYENTFFCPIILRCHVLYLLLEGTGIENKINSNLLPFRTRYWDLRQNSRVQKNINVYNWEKVFKKKLLSLFLLHIAFNGTSIWICFHLRSCLFRASLLIQLIAIQ